MLLNMRFIAAGHLKVLSNASLILMMQIISIFIHTYAFLLNTGFLYRSKYINANLEYLSEVLSYGISNASKTEIFP